MEAITLQLEELTKDVTWRGGRPEDLPDTDTMFEELWWEIKHNAFCLCELSCAKQNLAWATTRGSQDFRYKAAKECRISLRALRRRALGIDNGHGADLDESPTGELYIDTTESQHLTSW